MKNDKLGPKPAAGRRARIEGLLRRCEELSGGHAVHWHSDDCPPEILEEFLERVVAFEEAPKFSLLERLRARGCPTPSPDSLGEDQLPGVMRKIASALAEEGFYLERTDHLSDRELYRRLWSRTLHAEFEDPPDGGHWRVDLAGSGSEEDVLVHLRYYADELDRIEWMEEFPDFEMPKPRKLPFDRDRFLPKPPREP